MWTERIGENGPVIPYSGWVVVPITMRTDRPRAGQRRSAARRGVRPDGWCRWTGRHRPPTGRPAPAPEPLSWLRSTTSNACEASTAGDPCEASTAGDSREQHQEHDAGGGGEHRSPERGEGDQAAHLGECPAGAFA